MNSETVFNGSEEKELLCRLNDLYRVSQKKDIIKYTAFLNEKEQYVAEVFAAKKRTSVIFYGGYENAVRKIAAFGINFTDYQDIFPISAVTFSYNSCRNLSNRDFLGAVMSLGIERRMLGDIIVGSGNAAVFCVDTIQPLLLYEIEKVGKTAVKAEKGVLFPIPEKNYLILRCVVASLRLDCFVSGVTGLNREKSSELIRLKRVQINYAVCEKNSKILNTGDIITIKGYGKFIFSEIEGITKKENIRIAIKKYI